MYRRTSLVEPATHHQCLIRNDLIDRLITITETFASTTCPQCATTMRGLSRRYRALLDAVLGASELASACRALARIPRRSAVMRQRLSAWGPLTTRPSVRPSVPRCLSYWPVLADRPSNRLHFTQSRRPAGQRLWNNSCCFLEGQIRALGAGRT